MSRPPYPARVIAGLVVITIEETRKFPTRLITFPMTAISHGLQAGMRMQQNIAELAIKGDEVLAPYFDKTEEQPEWARFDEDDDTNSASAPLVTDAPRSIPEVDKPVAKKTPSTPSPTAAKAKPAETGSASAPETNGTAANGKTNSGRFALYSSAPTEVTNGATNRTTDSTQPLPPTVAELDYPNLTLAQLRAKVRGLGVDELTELRAFEAENRNRTPFVTMIDNRISSQQKKSEPTK
ncbi:lipid droplet-associated protein [Gordonia sp. (in: high G+C Gram-positive bacteria)]|uniref:lipid droplet-associated protein n=1 Tax=Gordonia sp. (in: high G+C Gram-positive bacteria) TaxID=84139 RepID=UPI003C757870